MILQRKRAALDWLMEQTTSLGRALCDRSLPLVPCHADIHAGNVLVDARGRLHLLDLDTLLLAPRERDLMFIGAGVAGHWRDAQEAAWFYEGYGPQQPDPQGHGLLSLRAHRRGLWWTTVSRSWAKTRARTGHSPWPSCNVSWRPAPNCRSPAAQLPRCLPQAAR